MILYNQKLASGYRISLLWLVSIALANERMSLVGHQLPYRMVIFDILRICVWSKVGFRKFKDEVSVRYHQKLDIGYLVERPFSFKSHSLWKWRLTSRYQLP